MREFISFSLSFSAPGRFSGTRPNIADAIEAAEAFAGDPVVARFLALRAVRAVYVRLGRPVAFTDGDLFLFSGRGYKFLAWDSRDLVLGDFSPHDLRAAWALSNLEAFDMSGNKISSVPAPVAARRLSDLEPSVGIAYVAKFRNASILLFGDAKFVFADLPEGRFTLKTVYRILPPLMKEQLFFTARDVVNRLVSLLISSPSTLSHVFSSAYKRMREGEREVFVNLVLDLSDEYTAPALPTDALFVVATEADVAYVMYDDYVRIPWSLKRRDVHKNSVSRALRLLKNSRHVITVGIDREEASKLISRYYVLHFIS